MRLPARKISDQTPAMQNLRTCRPGARVVVQGVAGGCSARRRLEDMGFLPGEQIEVVRVTSGPVLVHVRGARLALGAGMAAKVLVAPVEGEMPGWPD